MITPQEIEVWHIIPTIRKELSKAMLNYGLTQKEIAEKLNASEPAISLYLKAKRGSTTKFNETILNQIEISSKKIINNKSNFMRELMLITNLVKKEGITCQLHKSLDKTCWRCKYESILR